MRLLTAGKKAVFTDWSVGSLRLWQKASMEARNSVECGAGGWGAYLSVHSSLLLPFTPCFTLIIYHDPTHSLNLVCIAHLHWVKGITLQLDALSRTVLCSTTNRLSGRASQYRAASKTYHLPSRRNDYPNRREKLFHRQSSWYISNSRPFTST